MWIFTKDRLINTDNIIEFEVKEGKTPDSIWREGHHLYTPIAQPVAISGYSYQIALAPPSQNESDARAVINRIKEALTAQEEVLVLE